MKVLIGNFHNSDFGGGELYTYQVAEAISHFADIYFVQAPNKNLMASNPSLKTPYSLWDGKAEMDYFLNISHFKTLICNTAKKNILVTFFPNEKHKVADYSQVVSICEYAAGYTEKYWGVSGSVCEPYAFDISPGFKQPNTIVSVGNFFKEVDGHSKNQHVLIDTFKKLHGNWKLTLIGSEVSPLYVEELRKLAAGLNVEILKNVPESDKNKILATSEFYWHANGYGRIDPYQTEHFGIAPVEALKAGCLTYVHASGGAQDFCKSWQSIAELVEMTNKREPNFVDNHFQTPELMRDFWEMTLCTPS